MPKPPILGDAVLWLGACVALALAVYGWRKRSEPGAWALVAAMLGVAVHTVAFLLRFHTAGTLAQLLLAQAMVVGWDVALSGFLIFALYYTGRQRWLRSPIILVTLAFRLASTVLVLTNPWHHLFYAEIGTPAHNLDPTPGPWSAAHGASSLVLALMAFGLFATLATQVPRYYRGRAALMAVASALPVFAVAVQVYVTDHTATARYVPIGFALSGLVMALTVHPAGLLDLAPVARDLVFRRMTGAILVLDGQGRVADLNSAASKLLGAPVDSAIGRTVGEVAGHLTALTKLAGHRTPGEYEIAARTPQGKRYYGVRVSPIAQYRGRTTGTAFLLHDITLRKEATLALESAHKELQSLARLRDDLTNMIVHDLRTPLTSLLAGLQTIEAIGGLDEVQREMLGISIRGGKTLMGMINDLLNIGKMEEGSLPLHKSPLSATDLVEHAREQVEMLLEEAGQTLEAEVPPGLPTILADEELMRRTLVNLLGNAIKFTPTGGTIRISAQREGDGLLFAVRDTGHGIPSDSLERIFDKFAQVEDRKSGKYASTGLGLTLCKLVVEAHGGRIWAESVEDEGSTFRVWLPVG